MSERIDDVDDFDVEDYIHTLEQSAPDFLIPPPWFQRDVHRIIIELLQESPVGSTDVNQSQTANVCEPMSNQNRSCTDHGKGL